MPPGDAAAPHPFARDHQDTGDCADCGHGVSAQIHRAADPEHELCAFCGLEIDGLDCGHTREQTGQVAVLAVQGEGGAEEQETDVLASTGFQRCTFGPDGQECNGCDIAGLQLYYQRTCHDVDEGRYLCLTCISAEKAAHEMEGATADLQIELNDIKARLAVAEQVRKDMTIAIEAYGEQRDAARADLAIVAAIYDTAKHDYAVMMGQLGQVRSAAQPLPGHWKPQGLDWDEGGGDYPMAGSPEVVAKSYLTDKDLNEHTWDQRDALLSGEEVIVTLDQCEETTDLLAEDDQFDGYEPGGGYWRMTGKTVRVQLSIAAVVLP